MRVPPAAGWALRSRARSSRCTAEQIEVASAIGEGSAVHGAPAARRDRWRKVNETSRARRPARNPDPRSDERCRPARQPEAVSTNQPMTEQDEPITDRDQTEPEVQRYGPAASQPTRADLGPAGLVAAARHTSPQRRRGAALGAAPGHHHRPGDGIVSGALSASAVSNLSAARLPQTGRIGTPTGSNVSQVHIDESSAVITAVARVDARRGRHRATGAAGCSAARTGRAPASSSTRTGGS